MRQSGRPLGTGLTNKQVDYLLSGGSLDVSRVSLSHWEKDERFCALRDMVTIAKAKSIEGLVEKACKILYDALNGEHVAPEQVTAAIHILRTYKVNRKRKVIYRRWRGQNVQELPEEKARRALEEIQDDISAKSDVIPVEHVGNTKLGRKTRRSKTIDPLNEMIRNAEASD